MRGKYIRTKEFRERISNAHMGKPSGMLGKKMSEEAKQKISKAHTGMHTLSKNQNWVGGRIKLKNGYILVKSPTHPFRDRNSYVLEHRLVMEKHLG